MIAAAFSRRFSFQIYRSSQPLRGLATACALLGIFAVLVLGIRLFCHTSHDSTPFWPANGALVVAALVLPKRLSCPVLLFAGIINFVVNTVFFHDRLGQAIYMAALNVFLGLFLAILIRNFCGAATDLSRFRRLATFIGLAIIAAAVEAAIGMAWASMDHAASSTLVRWFWWALCDALGVIIGTPAVLLWVKNKRYVKFSGAGPAERIFFIFGDHFDRNNRFFAKPF